MPLAGAAVLVSRGKCAFTDKVLNVQAANAALAVVFNNEPGGPCTASHSFQGCSGRVFWTEVPISAIMSVMQRKRNFMVVDL
jgi:hypothetical protein